MKDLPQRINIAQTDKVKIEFLFLSQLYLFPEERRSISCFMRLVKVIIQSTKKLYTYKSKK